MKNAVCLLYANCIPVKGAQNSIICDLQRHNYIQIPTDLYDVLTIHKGKSIPEIKAAYENKYDKIIDNYFNILLDNEFAFLTDTPELFPEMNLEWEDPLEVSNAIVDFDESSSFDLQAVLEQLSELHCRFVQMRFYRKTSVDELREILDYLDSIQSNSIGIDFILPYWDKNENKDFVALFKAYKRMNSVNIYDSPYGKHIHPVGHSKYLIHTASKVVSEKSCGVIEKAFFSIHLKTFSEAQKHNTCLNGKVSVDKQGEIRNCPAMPESFGNVETIKLRDAIKDARFKKYWNLNKDQVEVCKDCEFRYICTDCRAFTVDSSNDKSKPLKCGYNPYTGEWKAWSENNLKQSLKTEIV